MGAAPDSYEPGVGYVLYPRDHALVSPRHILLAIQIPSNNLLVLVQVYSIHSLGKCVEDNLARMPVMDGYGQEVEVVYSGLVADAGANITVCSRHVHFHIKRDREFSALP